MVLASVWRFLFFTDFFTPIFLSRLLDGKWPTEPPTWWILAGSSGTIEISFCVYPSLGNEISHYGFLYCQKISQFIYYSPKAYVILYSWIFFNSKYVSPSLYLPIYVTLMLIDHIRFTHALSSLLSIQPVWWLKPATEVLRGIPHVMRILN